MSDGTETRLDALEERIGQIEARLSAHDGSIESLARMAAELLRGLRQSASEDRAILRELQNSANEDRALIREIQSEVRGLQVENRQILDYLFQQRNNGGGGSR
ncbi:hypothetical protein [Kamptonema formosum]|uniref:hypothetical protein n=1 Tax=Kamptonema formosum TaxID=331992 RepID=UPI00034708E6|nr:hypothetical protein [Oscillatoria sp. PCC 10802]